MSGNSSAAMQGPNFEQPGGIVRFSYTTSRVDGCWIGDTSMGVNASDELGNALLQVTKPLFLFEIAGKLNLSNTGVALVGKKHSPGDESFPLCAYLPPLPPGSLGDPLFKERFGLHFPYVAGAMANGIASVEMVRAMGEAGMIGFFGAGGLSLERIEAAIQQLQHQMPSLPFGFNLIHSPNDPALESATVQLYLDRGVRLVSAAAYLRLTPALVYFRIKGIHEDSQGNIVCPNKVIAKVSRVEVARQFFAPPAEKILKKLLEEKKITEQEAALARRIPVADTMTAEADSGGHTDNRPALALLPTMLSLRNTMEKQYGYAEPLLVGLAGGIATPASTAAAFCMGAAYVLTGSVNQACIESGTSTDARKMLSEADQADVTMAPSADMFQMGVKVQVLKRGTMFPVRAAKLYDLYSQYESVEQLPAKERDELEKKYFQQSLEAEWRQTELFFQKRDPRQIERAETNAKHKMALLFRSYLGRSSIWAVTGDPTRKMDYQVWCGPAIGAFNEWARGSFLEKPENRQVAVVAMNLLLGAAVETRLGWLRNQGVSLTDGIGRFTPMELPRIQELIGQ